MKNITLSDEDQVIDSLRRLAEADKTTVNNLFREWSRAYIQNRSKAETAKRLQSLRESYEVVSFTSPRKLTREEMNER